jgi:uncharacterized membrane protein HdeD (DUF308 family)
MKTLAIIVLILGLASLVMGVIFVINSGSARNEVADSIAPLPLGNLNAQYDQVRAGRLQMAPAEGAAINAGQAPSALYSWMTLEETSLGLARSSAGVANLTMILGYLNLVIGIALIIVSLGMMRKTATA